MSVDARDRDGLLRWLSSPVGMAALFVLADIGIALGDPQRWVVLALLVIWQTLDVVMLQACRWYREALDIEKSLRDMENRRTDGR